MKQFILSICTLCILFCVQINAQNDYPIVEKNGKKYYEYTILQGDGLFAIARKFNIKQNDLHEANQNLSTDIKAGNKILIPIKENSIQQNNQVSTIHIVEAKQTLYSISRMYNVPVDSIIALNPSTKTGIKIGETLIISRDKQINKQQNISTDINTAPTTTNDITHLVQRKETLYSISKKYNIAIHDLISQNPKLKDGLKAGQTIIIKDSKIENTTNNKNIDTESIKEKENNTNTITKTDDNTRTEIKTNNTITTSNSEILNIAYLLPLIPENPNEEKNTQRFIEFYRGSILALNDAKTEGISANIYTYDLPKSTNKIDSVLNLLNNKTIDIVIGPAYSEQLEKVLSYTKQHNITTIVPFSSKIDTTHYYPKLIQFNPPQDSLFNTVLKNTFAHRNLQYILARFENCNNKGNLFVEELAKLLTENNKEFTDIIIKPKYIDSVITKITPDTTILILGSSRINDVAPILDSLNRYQLPNLQVWGFEEWGANIIKKYPQTLYYSLFYPNETEEYKQNYKNWFGTRKQSVGAKYDLLGYDMTQLAIKAINTTDTTLTFKNTNINFLQSKPQLEFINNRWLNTNYYLLFWDNITIKDIDNKE